MRRPVSIVLLFLIITALHAQNERFSMDQVGTDHSLNYPWEVIYGPDDMLWITERAGKRVVRADPDSGEKDELITISEVYQASTQDGLLGMALHPGLGMSEDTDYVYLSYTYESNGRKQKLVRYRYNITGTDGSLSDPVDLITGMPASNDHNSGRLLYGPDHKLYYTIGDQGKNQYAYMCEPIMAQVLPTKEEINNQDWSSYQGKILRLNPDGSIPEDNPVIEGVQSHIYSYGHRNAQGLVFTKSGHLFSAEHGPKSDDELNRIVAGKNYGWPHVAGYPDDQAYRYCQWASAGNCHSLSFDDFGCPDGALITDESSWSHPDFVPPVKTFYTVENGYDFIDPQCNILFICWPTIAPSSIDMYESANAIPGWNSSLLIVSLKRGRVYRQPVDENTEESGQAVEYWDTQNRYRDIAIHPDGKTFYVITDNMGQTSGPSSGNTSSLKNPGTILKFEYQGEPLAGFEMNRDKKISISPNPASQYVSLKYPQSLNKVLKEIRIINIQGKPELITQSLSGQTVLDIRHLISGLYFIQTTIDGTILTERLMVEI